MNLDFRIDGDKVRVKLTGDIDEYSARALRAELDGIIERQRMRALILDMGSVSFIDSTGLGFVLGRYKKLREKRAELLLSNVPQQVDKVFRTSGVYSFVPKID